MKGSLLALAVTLGLVSSASAATLSVDTDAKFYRLSDTITVTMVLTVGPPDSAGAVFGGIHWDAGIASPIGNSSQDVALTSFNGGVVWRLAGGACLPGSCLLVDQVASFQPIPLDPKVVTGMLQLHVDDFGSLNLAISAADIDIPGITPGDVTLGANFINVRIVPEPGTAAMVGLGLLGLATVGRRRN